MTPSGGLRAADERLEKNDSDLLDVRHKLDGFAEAVGVTALEQR
jgi:HPt (histidine-containing phosphotransfer) domain-containing protein